MAAMQIADALVVLSQVLTGVTNSVAQANQISTIIKGAQAQNRTTLTDDEWTIVNQANATSRQALVDAITKALAGS